MSEIEQLMIKLAKLTPIDRFTPFPNWYRIISSDWELPTSDEFNKMSIDLHASPVNDKLYKFITTPKLNIVLHDTGNVNNLNNLNISEYEFKYSEQSEIINNIKHPTRWYLYHGSPITNWYSILNNGIKNMSNTKLMSTGAAYGPGVYLSDNLLTSYAYGGRSQAVCIAVVEILVDYNQFKKAPGIFVIPNDTLLIPRYLLKIPVGNKCPAISTTCNNQTCIILNQYKIRRDILIRNNIKVNRALFDINRIDPSLLLSRSSSKLIIKINMNLTTHVKIIIYLWSYPISKPLIQLVDNTIITNNFDGITGIYKKDFPWSIKNTINDVISYLYEEFSNESLIEYPVCYNFTQLV